MKKNTVLSIVILFLLGCGGFSQESKIVKDYALFSLESTTDTMLVRKKENENMEVIVKPFVFAIGWDNNFIIVKRNDIALKMKKVEFYIINVNNDLIYGPYTSDEFNAERKVLGVSEKLDFTTGEERNWRRLGEGLI